MIVVRRGYIVTISSPSEVLSNSCMVRFHKPYCSNHWHLHCELLRQVSSHEHTVFNILEDVLQTVRIWRLPYWSSLNEYLTPEHCSWPDVTKIIVLTFRGLQFLILPFFKKKLCYYELVLLQNYGAISHLKSNSFRIEAKVNVLGAMDVEKIDLRQSSPHDGSRWNCR